MEKTVIIPWLQTLVLDISLIAYEWIRSGELRDSGSGCESQTSSSDTDRSQGYLQDTSIKTFLNGSNFDDKLENRCEASTTVDSRTSRKSKNACEQSGCREDTTRFVPEVLRSSADSNVDFPDDLVVLREQILQGLNEVSSRLLTNSTSDKFLSAENGIKSHDTVEAPRKVVVDRNAALFRELAHFVFPKESSIESLDRYCQTENEFQVEDEGTQTSNDECNFQKLPLVEKIATLEKELERRDENWKMHENHFRMTIRELEERNDGLEDQVSKIDEHLEKTVQELRETLLELGRLSVENTMIKRREKLQSPNLSQSKEISTQTSKAALRQATSESGRSLGAEALMDQVEQIVDNPQTNVSSRPAEVAASSVKVSSEESSGREGINLSHVPTNAVERSVYNNYKMLLLLISHRLLSSDIAKLKEWVNSAFSVNVSQDVDEIFLQLDRKGVISSSNLEPLGAFFERIVRIDLKHLIDCFLMGDYGFLRATNSIDIARKNRRTTSSGAGSTSSQLTTGNPSAKSSRTSASAMKRPDYAFASSNARVADRGYSASSNVNIGGKSRSFFDNNSGYQDRGTVVADGTAQNDNVAQDRAVNLRNQSRGTEKTYSTDTANSHTSKSYANMGSNGNKLSKFQRTDSSPNRNSRSQGRNSDFDDDDSDSSWLCSHYKRRCHVKFSCCDQYWPCHRCHNNESECGEKKLRSRDTKFIKCVNCGTEQEFSESSQFCANCNTKLAKYFCAICKHLTGEDDNPYHCEKCGICRIHRERSFHCDVCGVCLDVQLRGNHKCRAGSAHDECCICLEDAFTGCQILPCSHKVHKECATQMIRRGITRCPICRESFAHKLEKRPIQTPKKPTGKK